MEQPTHDLPSDMEWPEATIRWWKDLQSTPGSESWTASDWDHLTTIALLHADVWGSGNFDRIPMLSKELAQYGITPAARNQIEQAKIQKAKDETALDKAMAKRNKKKKAVSHRAQTRQADA